MIENALAFTFPAAFALLPGVMNTPEARAMLLSIALQESAFRWRRQREGPARGFWMFEQKGGTEGVLTHEASSAHAHHVCAELLYAPLSSVCYPALEHNDVLACCFGRLLLWTHPDRLPPRGSPDRAWRIYLDSWRPGKPHPETWPLHYWKAWELVQPGA